MTPTLDELREALLKAHMAGDESSAKTLAAEIAKLPPDLVNADPKMFKPAEYDTGEKEGLITRGLKGAAQGAMGVFMPGNMVETVNQLFGMPNRGTMFPTTEDTVKAIKGTTGLNLASPPAQTPAEKFTQSGSELAGSMTALGPMGPGAIIRRGILGGGAGLVGQASENAFPGSKGYADVLALLLGGGLGFRTPNAVKAVRSAMDELTPAELAAAQRRVDQAAGQFGVRGPFVQGFDRPTQLEGIHNAVVASPEGGQLASALARQLTAASERSSSLVDDLTQAPISGAEANRVAGVGAHAVREPARQRTDLTAQDYITAGNTPLPPFAVPYLTNMLEQRRAGRNMPVGSPAGDVYAGVQRDLRSLPMPTNPLEVNAFLREQAGRARKADVDPLATSDVVASRFDVSRSGKELLKSLSPEFDAAEQAYRAHSGPVNAMETSRMPHYFGAEAKAGRGEFSAYAKMLEEHPDQIRFIARNLESSDATRQAFPQIVKASWESKWSKAFESPTGRPSGTAPGKFATDIAGVRRADGSLTPEREQFRTTMEEVGRVHGVDPKAYADAAETLADALHTASRGRQALGKVDTGELKRRAGANIGSAVMRTPGVLVGASPWSAALERMIGDRTFAKISDAFLSPDAIKKLMAIKDYSAMRNAANLVARDLLSVQSAGATYNFGPESTTEKSTQ